MTMIDISSATIEDLLEAIRSDQDEIFTQLVTRYHRGLVSLARTFLREGEAEEVVQEAWISAYENIGKFEGRSSIRTWLAQIVMNAARMRLRKAGREINLDFSSGETDALSNRFTEDGKWRDPPLDWEINSPDELLQEQNLLDCLHKTLEKLPVNQKLVLELRDVQGLELDDICTTLAISAANVRVLLHRARTQLFSMVDHYQETGEC
jgi:RNA polymerase sigma-70 factor (ECF subfamily)